MVEAVDFFQILLATFGISFCLAATHGPLGIFAFVRSAVQARTNAEWVIAGVECPVCVSFWVGIPVSFLMGGGPEEWLASIGFASTVMLLSPPAD